jgi:hypothetical protein
MKNQINKVQFEGISQNQKLDKISNFNQTREKSQIHKMDSCNFWISCAAVRVLHTLLNHNRRMYLPAFPFFREVNHICVLMKGDFGSLLNEEKS